VSRLLEMHANERTERKEVYAGDIIAVVGLKNTTTGDTLCDEGRPVVLEKIEFAEPVVHVAIEPRTRADQDQLHAALGKLLEEDPTFRVQSDPETGQTVMSGMGELHLEILTDRLFREFKVEANIGRPQVAYKEGLRRKAHGTGRFVRQTGGRGQVRSRRGGVRARRARQRPDLRIGARGRGNPARIRQPVRDGIAEAMSVGPVAGYPVEDVKAILVDGSYHEVDSSEMAFKVAGSLAFKDGRAGRSPS